MLTKEAWEEVFLEVEKQRATYRTLLEGGSCHEPHVYGEKIGFLKGLKFYEDRILEAKKRSSRNYQPEPLEE